MTTTPQISNGQRRATARIHRPKRLGALVLHDSILDPIEQHLRTTGRDGCEEAALIAGYIAQPGLGIGVTALLPYTKHTAGSCSIPLDVTHRCAVFTKQRKMFFLAQVHTHPGRCCNHSATDDDWSVSDAPGFFSIVIPSFCRFGLRRMFESGASISERLVDGSWHQLTPDEVRRRVVLISAACEFV